MRFSGEMRVPEVDHPGVPVNFVVDDKQAELLLEGESLGRWSLFDVRVSRLVGNAFQVELDSEEVTFLADDPIDFAYRGVEHMAEAWARYKTMAIPRRVVAVARSRRGIKDSRIGEFRSAMEQNLLAEEQATITREPLAGEAAARGEVLESPTPPVEEPLAEQPTIPVAEEPAADVVEETHLEEEKRATDRVRELTRLEEERRAADEAREQARLETERLASEAREAERIASERAAEAERLASERAALEAERAQLDEQKAALSQALAEAERLERERLEAAARDAQRIEDERKALEQRFEREHQDAEKIEQERLELQKLEEERLAKERQQAEQLEAAKQVEMARLEKQRKELERLEAERVERERQEREKLETERQKLKRVEQERAEAARIEVEKLQREREDLERREHELSLAREQADRDRVEAERAAAEQAEKARLETEELARREAEEQSLVESEEEEREVAAAEPDMPVEDTREDQVVEEVLGTSGGDEEPETSKQLVVDLGAFEKKQPDDEEPSTPETTEPALAGAAEKSGLMGAVKAAFGRSSRNHVHDFTEAPGGLGMVRRVCRDCGYVSITSAD